MYIHTYIDTYVVHTYIHTYVLTYIYTYIHTHTHTHTHNIHAVRGIRKTYSKQSMNRFTLISPVCAGNHSYIDMRIFTPNQVVISVPAQE